MMFIFQGTGFKVGGKTNIEPSLGAPVLNYDDIVRPKLVELGVGAEKLKSLDTLNKEGKLTLRDVKDIIGDSLWDQFQKWWKQQELGKELLDGLPKAGKTPDATRRANEKKTKENVDESLKEGEREKAKHPPKIPAPSEKKDTIVVTDKGIETKQD